MNNHSKDLQTRYLREAAIVLAKEGFQLDEVHTDRLCILLPLYYLFLILLQFG